MSEWLLSLPAYLKVGVSFSGILLINRLGVTLGLAILLFSLVLSFWSGAGLAALSFVRETFTQPEDYLLPPVIALLLFFSEALTKTGRIEQTMQALKDVFKSKKILFIGLPALIGLLPMPGGAIFSAPLVASVDREEESSAAEKAAINYWFRHIWEYWWPIYPGVFLAVTYSGLPLAVFFLIQMPYTLAALLGGYLFILRKVKKVVPEDSVATKFSVKGLSAALIPIMILIITAVLGSFLFPGKGISNTVASLISMLIGLVMAIIAAFTGHRQGWKPSLGIFQRSNTWLMILMVVSLQVFSAVLKCPLDAAGTTIVTAMRNEFVSAGIPILIVIMMVPFISGMVTGVAFGFVGTSFPIVFALVGQQLPLGVAAATTALAYGCGYMGMMISPMHICFVVSCSYFQVPLAWVYPYLAKPALLMLFTTFLISGLYYLLL